MVYTPDELNAIPNVDYNDANASHSDVFYYFYRNATQIDGILILNDDDGDKIANIEFDRDRPTKFFFHGYTTSYKSPWYPLLKQQYYDKGQHNIFYVDWQKAGNLTFKISAANIKPIGEYIADFILTTQIPFKQIHLIGNYNVDNNSKLFTMRSTLYYVLLIVNDYNSHFQGHSLGSHLTGFVGKSIYRKTGKKLARITALDAAGPGFDRLTNASLRLCQNDAEFVDAYHTDIDYYGFKCPLGHVDFYPNYGKHQPGCNREIDDNASHARSTLFFIESIANNGIKAKKAKYLGDETIEIIESCGDSIGFGDHLTGEERGVYFVESAAEAPFFKKTT